MDFGRDANNKGLKIESPRCSACIKRCFKLAMLLKYCAAPLTITVVKSSLVTSLHPTKVNVSKHYLYALVVELPLHLD